MGRHLIAKIVFGHIVPHLGLESKDRFQSLSGELLRDLDLCFRSYIIVKRGYLADFWGYLVDFQNSIPRSFLYVQKVSVYGTRLEL